VRGTGFCAAQLPFTRARLPFTRARLPFARARLPFTPARKTFSRQRNGQGPRASDAFTRASESKTHANAIFTSANEGKALSRCQTKRQPSASGRRSSRTPPDRRSTGGGANDKGDGFGFQFSGVTRGRSIVRAVKQFMRIHEQAS
jgi:hypothetical protein